MAHLLVTNDFPPKLGGIQSYLHELWRRLPVETASVLTTPYRGAELFDSGETLEIERYRRRVLLPYPSVRRLVRRRAAEKGCGLVMIDPAIPLGLIGPGLGLSYGVVLHGAEVTVPARLAGLRRMLARVVAGSSLVVAAGGYPANEARQLVGERLPPLVEIPPGVDLDRFSPLGGEEKAALRRRYGLSEASVVVLGLHRLVPRKGADVLIRAVARLRANHPETELVIAGEGRDERRLRALSRRAGVGVRFLGRVPEADKPLVYAAADVYAMCCRERWLGLEQEGFGIVFLEAAACGLPSLAGRSGGASEAVEDRVTGLVVDDPRDERQVEQALGRLVADEALRDSYGRAARTRAEALFSYDVLAGRLHDALVAAGG